jgi:hypothetical protein
VFIGEPEEKGMTEPTRLTHVLPLVALFFPNRHSPPLRLRLGNTHGVCCIQQLLIAQRRWMA